MTRDDPARPVALFGLFGVGNIGNEASLDAGIAAVRRHWPNSPVVVVAADPGRVTREHRIEAVPISMSGAVRRFDGATRVVRLLVRPAVELARWVASYRFVRSVRMLVVPGTGILDDFGVRPHQMPYDLMRWSTVARMARRPWSMVGVGAGPIDHPVSRWLMRRAALNARVVTYRDEESRTFMAGLNAATGRPALQPDVAFSLPRPPADRRDGDDREIGLGVMAYYGWTNDPAEGERTFEAYTAAMTELGTRLLSAGHHVRVVIGERSDIVAAERIVASLEASHDALTNGALVFEPISSFDELMTQIARTDVLVATRYHNVIAGLMTATPTVSIGYADKNRAVMARFGLEDMCHHVDDIDVDAVERDVERLLAGAAQATDALRATVDRLASEVIDRFDDVLDRLGVDSARAGDTRDVTSAVAAVAPVPPTGACGRTPRLSIGLAVYNGENYLREAIESILGQTYTDFELIISDNASTDATAEICSQYSDDPRVRYHRNETNIGGANNENQTFLMSRGEYFRLAAHDDVCHPRLFEACVEALDRHPDAVLCYTRTVTIDEAGVKTSETVLGRGTASSPSARFRELASRAHNCEPTYGVIRSSVLRTTPLQRNYTDSDRVLLCELALKGRFIELDEPLFYKRYHEKNHYTDWRERMSWFRPDRTRGTIEFPNWIELYHMFHTAVTIPVGLSTKIRCAGWAVVWAGRCTRSLGGDVYAALRALTAPRRDLEDWRYNWE